MKRNTKSPNATDKHVSVCIRGARLQAGLSLRWVADELGVTFNQLLKYEKGTNRVSAGRLAQIAELTDKPIAFFFPDREQKRRAA